jgi:hypothetical protein
MTHTHTHRESVCVTYEKRLFQCVTRNATTKERILQILQFFTKKTRSWTIVSQNVHFSLVLSVIHAFWHWCKMGFCNEPFRALKKITPSNKQVSPCKLTEIWSFDRWQGTFRFWKGSMRAESGNRSPQWDCETNNNVTAQTCIETTQGQVRCRKLWSAH